MEIVASSSDPEGNHGCLQDGQKQFTVKPKMAPDELTASQTNSDEQSPMWDLELRDLRPVAKLGDGGFGEVLLVRHPSGHECALKKMSKVHFRGKQAREQLISERDTMLQCDNGFVVKLYETFSDEEFHYMLLEPALGGDLFQLLQNSPRTLTCDGGAASLFYAACISEAIGHIHERHIVYRDLKLENILLDSTGYVKLCDFGFAKFVSEKTYTICGTPQYIAPEMIDFPHAHDGCVDWWALGVVVFELLTSEEPWYEHRQDSHDGVCDLQELRRSHEAGPDLSLIPAGLLNARDFVRRLLCPCPGQRLGANRDLEEIKEHAWPVQEGFDWNALIRRELRAPFAPTDAKITGSSTSQTTQLSRVSSSTSAGTGSSNASVHSSEGQASWTTGWSAVLFYVVHAVQKAV